jgi:hypothetical protein
MHEIAGDEKGFHRGDEKSDCNIDRAVPKMNVRGCDRDHRSEKQCVENKKISLNGLFDVVGTVIAHRVAGQSK